MTSFEFNKGPELYRKAKEIIPGGTQLLSKRPEMFLPDLWPSYYDKAKGVEIWDLDGNRLVDMTTSGIGTCILGYADDDVNSAVKTAIDKGSMTTLNCPEEVDLAELLCELHPWANMVRFARSGGEGLTVAIRIARAATGRDKIAFCGYHGWHDWYLSANLGDGKNLDAQLLPGLKPSGVPKNLQGTMLPFHYNNFDELEKVFAENSGEVAAIVMEPVRHDDPENDFLVKVRKLASDNNAVLIFDEVTAGWRMNVGGVHLNYGVNPDLAVFGKGISNGYPLSAVIGRREFMDAAQTSFISSTYWTERVGFAAGLATIQKMKDLNVPETLNRMATLVRDGWTRLAEKHGVKLKLLGFPPLSVVTFPYEGDLGQSVSTLYTQELLKRGYLASKPFYVSYALTEEIADKFLEATDEVFALMAKAINEESVNSYLDSRPADTGFKRLN